LHGWGSRGRTHFTRHDAGHLDRGRLARRDLKSPRPKLLANRACFLTLPGRHRENNLAQGVPLRRCVTTTSAPQAGRDCVGRAPASRPVFPSLEHTASVQRCLIPGRLHTPDGWRARQPPFRQRACSPLSREDSPSARGAGHPRLSAGAPTSRRPLLPVARVAG
jgi:hypothetical protein